MTNRLLPFALALSITAFASDISYADDGDIDTSRVQEGFDVSPIPKTKLKLGANHPAKVGWGSYLVNAVGDCSGCHSFPRFLEKGDTAGGNPSAGDPYEGAPSTQTVTTQLLANLNVSHYLAGGQCFGPYMARNLTPDANGLPEGLTETDFIKVMRTGEDIHCEKYPTDPICTLVLYPAAVLQVMPWATYHGMTNYDLKAIYAYLSAIPAANACNTVADGCPGFSGLAKNSSTYAYTSTADCPNPAPPQ